MATAKDNKDKAGNSEENEQEVPEKIAVDAPLPMIEWITGLKIFVTVAYNEGLVKDKPVFTASELMAGYMGYLKNFRATHNYGNSGKSGDSDRSDTKGSGSKDSGGKRKFTGKGRQFKNKAGKEIGTATENQRKALYRSWKNDEYDKNPFEDVISFEEASEALSALIGDKDGE